MDQDKFVLNLGECLGKLVLQRYIVTIIQKTRMTFCGSLKKTNKKTKYGEIRAGSKCLPRNPCVLLSVA